jgi:hypothetical protein
MLLTKMEKLQKIQCDFKSFVCDAMGIYCFSFFQIPNVFFPDLRSIVFRGNFVLKISNNFIHPQTAKNILNLDVENHFPSSMKILQQYQNLQSLRLDFKPQNNFWKLKIDDFAEEDFDFPHLKHF